MIGNEKFEPARSSEQALSDLFIELKLKELHQLVWSKPISAIAKDLSISATSLTKACDDYQIPRPISGHWTLVSLGKSPSITKIPKQVDKNQIIQLKKTLKSNIKKQKTKPNKMIKVPEKTSKPHPLTLIAKQHYKKPTFEYDKLMVIPRQIETYQFAVSMDKFNRALNIFDTLIKYFEKQGWAFKVTDNFTRRNKINGVVIDGKTVTFKLREKTKQTPRELNKKEQADKETGRNLYYEKILMPTGIFHLTIEEYVEGNCKRNFIDKPNNLIEENLDEFVNALVATSNYLKQRDTERVEEEQERQNQEELNKFFNKEVQKEVGNISFLYEQFEIWQKTEKAKQFVAAIKQRILDSGEITKDQEKWLLWAKKILTVEDPVAKAIELSNITKIEDGLTQSIDAMAHSHYFDSSLNVDCNFLTKERLNQLLNHRIKNN